MLRQISETGVRHVWRSRLTPAELPHPAAPRMCRPGRHLRARPIGWQELRTTYADKVIQEALWSMRNTIESRFSGAGTARNGEPQLPRTIAFIASSKS